MSSSALARTVPDFFSGYGSDFHRQVDLAPLDAAMPNILLIDEDATFVQAFERYARWYDVPVRSFASILSFEHKLQWEYDLVLVDLETAGREFLPEVIDDIQATHGRIPILVIGQETPNARDARHWRNKVSGFSNKEKGVKSVFNDAIGEFASGRHNRSAKLTLVR